MAHLARLNRGFLLRTEACERSGGTNILLGPSSLLTRYPNAGSMCPKSLGGSLQQYSNKASVSGEMTPSMQGIGENTRAFMSCQNHKAREVNRKPDLQLTRRIEHADKGNVVWLEQNKEASQKTNQEDQSCSNEIFQAFTQRDVNYVPQPLWTASRPLSRVVPPAPTHRRLPYIGLSFFPCRASKTCANG